MTEFVNGQAVDAGRVGMEVTPTFNEVTGEYTGLDLHSNFPLEGDGQNIEYSYEDPNAIEPNANDQYVQTLFEAYPDLSNALDWAADNWPAEMVERFNNSVDADDLSVMMPLLEELMEQYGQLDYEQQEYYDQEEESEPYEITQQDFDSEIESLLDVQPDYSLADGLLQEADYAQNEIAASILEAAALFHAGQMSAEQAIDSVLNDYDPAEVAEIYAEMVNY